ncbi:ribosomal protein S5 domain 2-type protein [Lipomyces arxii]|uniref:mitochondrial 37S ribosomal protein uS9m n=1 Tax=Lipomyces arxii TaxID=56418 RepID=UPI0034CE9E0A
MIPRTLDVSRTQRRAGEIWESWNGDDGLLHGDQLQNRRRVARSEDPHTVLPLARAVPKSASYFTHRWFHNDRILSLSRLLSKYARLRRVGTYQHRDFRPIDAMGFRGTDPTGMSRRREYSGTLNVIMKLARIRPDLRPPEVVEVLREFGSKQNNVEEIKEERELDLLGRSWGKGKRKNAQARVWLVRGSGQILINGKNITEVFSRIQDRVASLRPLEIVGKLSEYNAFVIVSGGGSTGQSGAISLALARALRNHNPELTSILRKANCLKQDMRVVERKKPGKLKARKAPQWVKR